MVSRGRRLGLFFTSAVIATGTEQDGEGARQELGGPDEEWGRWISAGQEGLGVEPVLCAGGVHGVRPAVRGQGKERKETYFPRLFMAWESVVNHKVRSSGEIELVVNGGSTST